MQKGLTDKEAKAWRNIKSELKRNDIQQKQLAVKCGMHYKWLANDSSRRQLIRVFDVVNAFPELFTQEALARINDV